MLEYIYRVVSGPENDYDINNFRFYALTESDAQKQMDALKPFLNNCVSAELVWTKDLISPTNDDAKNVLTALHKNIIEGAILLKAQNILDEYLDNE